MLYRFDLHIHSCLSPCGDLECSPSAIAERAAEVGMNALMIADHNTSRNCPALAEVCRRTGLSCLFGMEVCTAEEIHCLAVFDTLEQADKMTEICYNALPKRVNQPEIFGDQPVVTADEDIVEMEWRILAAPTRLTLPQAEERIHGLGGLFIAAHIDRPAFSVCSQLGSVTGEEGFDAVELTKFASDADWADKRAGLPVLRNSDAHYLEDVGAQFNEMELPEFTVGALRAGLLRRASPGSGKPGLASDVYR